MTPVVLRTDRLELSLPTEGDIDAITDACQDPDVQRYTTVPVPYERRHAEEFVGKVAEHWRELSEVTWAIRREGTLVGMIGLHRLGRGDGEIGYWVSPSARGAGFVTEAADAVIRFGFDELDLARIEWRAVAGNVASARAARRVGFRYEGTLRAGLANTGGRYDAWLAGLLPGDDRTPVAWPVL